MRQKAINPELYGSELSAILQPEWAIKFEILYHV